MRWQESLRATQALMAAGMTTEAAVSQTEATCYSIETSVKDLEQTIRETENTLAVLLGETPQDIERGIKIGACGGCPVERLRQCVLGATYIRTVR